MIDIFDSVIFYPLFSIKYDPDDENFLNNCLQHSIYSSIELEHACEELLEWAMELDYKEEVLRAKENKRE